MIYSRANTSSCPQIGSWLSESARIVPFICIHINKLRGGYFRSRFLAGNMLHMGLRKINITTDKVNNNYMIHCKMSNSLFP